MRFTRDTMELPEVSPAEARASVSMARWAPFIRRLIVGYGFHAARLSQDCARNPGHSTETLATIGVPGPQIMDWLTVFVEIVGGLALLGALRALQRDALPADESPVRTLTIR